MPKEAWQALRSPVSEHLQAMIRWNRPGAVPMGVLHTNTPSTLAEVGRPSEPRRELEIDERRWSCMSVTRDLSHWAGVDAWRGFAQASSRPEPARLPAGCCYLLAARMVFSLVKFYSISRMRVAGGDNQALARVESSCPCLNLQSNDPTLICRSGGHSLPRFLCT